MEHSVDPNKIKFDAYIQEIEGSADDYWGPTFRAIYDGEDKEEEVMEALTERIKAHDRDIERMCNAHYQGFIDSIRELVQVRSQASKLKGAVVETNEALAASASRLADAMDELVKERRVEMNIASAIDRLSLCLPLLSTYAKLQRQMQDKRYYPALKTLEQLEHLHLPRVPNYSFCQQMKESIPTLRESIQKASMTDLKDFLENIRKRSPHIGEVAMKHTAEQQVSGTGTLVASNRLHTTPLGGEEELSAQELVDYSPVYRCLHVHSVLGRRAEFEEYYRQQRTEQASLLLRAPTAMHESADGFRSYLAAVVGFFVVEDHVFNSATGLISAGHLHSVWNASVPKIVGALRTHTAYCTDATLMLQIKNIIMLSITTLRNYGYSVGAMYDMLHEMHDHYNEVLMQRWVTVFRDMLDQHSFLPIQVTNPEEYEGVLATFPYQDPVLDAVDFPKKMPFSPMVPAVYQQVKEFIYACLKFSDDLNLSQVEVDEMMRKSTSLLLTRTFTGCLSSHLQRPSLSLSQLSQIILDTKYLEDSTVYLDQFVSNITGSGCDGQLGGRGELFGAAKEDAERQICEKLKAKVSEFIELESYDWLLAEPQGHASPYITDLIAFLQTTFQSFTNLPGEVGRVACTAACKHMAESVLGLLLSEDVCQLSMGALHQLNLDTIQCEQFAASEPVEGLEEGVLLTHFAELRQLLDLFMSWDWPTYFHDYGQESSKYNLVSPQAAISVLDKLREGDKKTVFSVLKKSERDKKKLLETVLKQLKQLAQTAHS